jgi:hypothetical protein
MLYLILVQRNDRIELTQAKYEKAPRVGQPIERMPGTVKESWDIIKVFEGDEHTRLMGLIGLTDLNTVKSLFEAKVLIPVAA